MKRPFWKTTLGLFVGWIVLFLLPLIPKVSLASGQEPAEPDQEVFALFAEEEMVMTPNRRSQLLPDVSASVNVISALEIRRSQRTHIPEILQDYPGVTVNRIPGFHVEYLNILRGYTSSFANERTLVMIDHVPIFEPSDGGIDLGLLPIGNINRIEVVKGPLSPLYGPNAFGGIIHILTKMGRENQGTRFSSRNRLFQSTDERDQIRLNHHLLIEAGGAHSFLSLEFLRHQGPVRHAGEKSLKAFAKVERNTAILGHVSLNFTSVFIDRFSPEDHHRLDPTLAYRVYQTGLTLDKSLSERYHRHIRIYYNLFDYHTIRATNFPDVSVLPSIGLDPNAVISAPFQLFSDSIGGEIQDTLHLGASIFTLGVDIRRDSSQKSIQVPQIQAMDPPCDIDTCSGFLLSDYGWSQKVGTTSGIYSQAEYLGIDRVRLMLGGRLDYNSRYGPAFSPRGGISRSLYSGLISYLTAGRAFRAPNYNEQFVKGFGEAGNPEIDPEYTTMVELGVKGGLPAQRGRFHLALFWQRIQDIIRPIGPETPLGSGNLLFINAGDARTIGLEGSINYRFTLGLEPFIHYTIYEAKEAQGGRALQIPRHKLVGGAHYYHSVGLTATLLGRFESPRFFETVTPANPLEISGFSVWDFRLTQSFGSIEISFFVENLLNRVYRNGYDQSHPSAPLPPQRVFGGGFFLEF